MKTLRLSFLSLALAFSGFPLIAQQPPPKPAATPAVAMPAKAAKPAAAAEIPFPDAPGKVAYISSDAFMAENFGIKKLAKVYANLAAQFKSRQDEIIMLNNKLNALGQEVQKLRATPGTNPQLIAGKETEGAQLQNTLQFKQQNAQTDYEKKSKEQAAPVEAEVVREMQAFIKERDIGMLFDLSKMGGAIVAAKPELDVTNDFIAYFNAKHP